MVNFVKSYIMVAWHKRGDFKKMCFWLDNLTTDEMHMIESEYKKRKRQKNLYPDKKIVKPKSDPDTLPLFVVKKPTLFT